MYHVEYLRQKEKQEELLRRKNEKSSFYNGIYLRWKNPVLTRDHVPLHWRYDQIGRASCRECRSRWSPYH